MQLDIKQNTPEWVELRKTCIGASDFNYYCAHRGLYKPSYPIPSLQQHFYNKRNGISFSNRFTRRGHDLEDEILKIFNEENSCELSPSVIFFKYDTKIIASLDGFNEKSKLGVEIKTTCTKISIEKLLEQYIYQIAHQLFVIKSHFINGFPTYFHTIYIRIIDEGRCIYKDYKGDCILYSTECKISVFDKDREMSIKSSIDIDFGKWRYICNEYLEKLHNTPEKNYQVNPDIYWKVQTYESLNEKLEEIKQKISLIKEEIADNIPDDGITIEDYIITKVFKSQIDYNFLENNIPEEYIKKEPDYKKYVQDMKIDIAPYSQKKFSHILIKNKKQ